MFNSKIIDCHCHIGQYFNFNVPQYHAEGMIQTMDAAGIDMACLTAHMALVGDTCKGNDIVLDAIDRFPQRFYGYITINPRFEKDTQEDFEKWFDHKNNIGIKIHTVTHQASITDPGYMWAYEQVNRTHKVILIHTDTLETLQAVEKLSLEYPNAKFLLGHFGGTVDLMKKAMKITHERDNVFGDTATSLIRMNNVKWLYENTKAHHLLYGSDMPFFDPRPNVGRVAYEDLKNSAKKEIFAQNMEKILADIQ